MNDQAEDRGWAGTASSGEAPDARFSSSLGPQTGASDPTVDLGGAEADLGGAEADLDGAGAGSGEPAPSGLAALKQRLSTGVNSTKAQVADRYSATKTQVAERTSATKAQVAERTSATKAQVAERTSATKTQVAERTSGANEKLGTFSSERPEVIVGAAFLGGLLIAMIVKRLAR